MKAIVLTCDKYLPFTDHMLRTYERLWRDNPFIFRVPYNNIFPEALVKKYNGKIEPVRAPVDIKGTVLELLRDISDDEWVWWCMDDSYLVKAKPKILNDIHKLVLAIKDSSLIVISPSRLRGFYAADRFYNIDSMMVTPSGYGLIESVFSKGDVLLGPWSHQFVRVKALRRIFENFPDRHFVAKEMDSFPIIKLPGERIFASKENCFTFGESTSRGKITANCALSFKKYGIKLPGNFSIDTKTYHVRGGFPRKIFGIQLEIPWSLRLRIVSLLLRFYGLK